MVRHQAENTSAILCTVTHCTHRQYTSPYTVHCNTLHCTHRHILCTVTHCTHRLTHHHILCTVTHCTHRLYTSPYTVHCNTLHTSTVHITTCVHCNTLHTSTYTSPYTTHCLPPHYPCGDWVSTIVLPRVYILVYRMTVHPVNTYAKTFPCVFLSPIIFHKCMS